MADNTKPGAAQNKLGELFVEFRTKGMGSLVKGLNTISSTFLLTKNAAEQMYKPIQQMAIKTASSVTAWDKLSSAMGFTIQQLQDIEFFSKRNSIDFNQYIGEIKTAQQRLMDIRTGMNNDIQGFTLLNLSPYDFDPRKPLELLDALKARVKDFDEVTASSALRWFGFSDDLLYIWKQQDDTLLDRLKLSDKETKNLLEQQRIWNTLSVSWDGAQRKFMANQTWINKLFEKTTEWLQGAHPLINKLGEDLGKWLDKPHPYINNLIEIIKQSQNGTLDTYIKGGGKKAKEIIEQEINLHKNPVKIPFDMDSKGKEIFLRNYKVGDPYNRYGEYLMELEIQKLNSNRTQKGFSSIGLPNPERNTTTNSQSYYNVVINQTNTGANAEQIAEKSSNKISDVLISLQYQNQPTI